MASAPTEYGELFLHDVTEDDLSAVKNAWSLDRKPISDSEARDVIRNMRQNAVQNRCGHIRHLCLAVCSKEKPGTILGWCGLDGSVHPTEPEIFIVLCEDARYNGVGTWCVREILKIAAETYALRSVHGGCARENLASRRVLEKGGMVQYGTNEEGDPQFRIVLNGQEWENDGI